MKSNIPKGLPGPSDILAILDLPVREASVLLACRSFCEYDKGENGEEGCHGLAAVRRALRAGLVGPDDLLPLAGQTPERGRKDPRLVFRLCASCSYLTDGCDFMASTPVADATPCGGYRLLLALMDRGLIEPGDL